MRIAICDDMQLFLDELHEMILKYCPEDLKPVMVDEFHSGEEFLESFSFGKYDAVILDIEMKRLNGLETAREIRKIDAAVPLAFHTSYSSISASKYGIHQYVFMKKRQDKSQYQQQFRKLFSRNRCINMPFRTSEAEIPLKQLVYIRKRWRRLQICTTQGMQDIHERMDDIAGLLPSEVLRIHKNYYVNTMYIDNYTVNKITMKNGQVLTVQEKYKKDLMHGIIGWN